MKKPAKKVEITFNKVAEFMFRVKITFGWWMKKNPTNVKNPTCGERCNNKWLQYFALHIATQAENNLEIQKFAQYFVDKYEASCFVASILIVVRFYSLLYCVQRIRRGIYFNNLRNIVATLQLDKAEAAFQLWKEKTEKTRLSASVASMLTRANPGLRFRILRI